MSAENSSIESSFLTDIDQAYQREIARISSDLKQFAEDHHREGVERLSRYLHELSLQWTKAAELHKDLGSSAMPTKPLAEAAAPTPLLAPPTPPLAAHSPAPKPIPAKAEVGPKVLPPIKPEPKPIEPEPTPPKLRIVAKAEPPKPTFNRQKRRALLATLYAGRDRSYDFGDPSLVELAELKEWICLGRALLADNPREPDSDSVREDVEHLQRVWQRSTGGHPFFGLNWAREHASGVWMELSEAYRRFAVALRAADLLETEELPVEVAKKLLMGAAACETCLFRLFMDAPQSTRDDDQVRLNERLRAIAERLDTYVPWWKSAAEGGPSFDVMKTDADRFEKDFDDSVARWRKSQAVEAVREQMRQIFEETPLFEDFETRLVRLAKEALRMGIAPSDKQLRQYFGPYRVLLAEANDDSLAKLIENLKRDEMDAIAKHAVVMDADIETNPEIEKYRDGLREMLKGKTLLFIGGNKRQRTRKDQLITELGLKDLIWPDSEDDTNMNSMIPSVDQCDVAALLIRWSRHSYKGLLDRAKEQGKPTAILPRGIGLNTVIADLYSQLIGGVERANVSE